MRWGELKRLDGQVIYSHIVNAEENYSEVSNIVLVKYNHSGMVDRLTEEYFPPNVPYCGEELNSVINENLVVVVSDLETYGDVDEYEDDYLVVVYDRKDVDVWVNKLKGLKLNY